MGSREARRAAVAHRVLDAIRHKAFRDETLANQSGDHVIVAALPDDTMAELFEQFKTAKSTMHVAVADSDALVMFVMAPHLPRSRHAKDSYRPDDPCPISPDTPVSMVLDYLRLADRPVLCRQATPEARLELVEGCTPQSV